MKEWMEQLRKEFPGLKVRSDVPYAELTTLGVGSRRLTSRKSRTKKNWRRF